MSRCTQTWTRQGCFSMAGQGPVEALLSSQPHFTSVEPGTIAPAVAPSAIPPFLDQAHLASSVHCTGLSRTSLPTLATLLHLSPLLLPPLAPLSPLLLPPLAPLSPLSLPPLALFSSLSHTSQLIAHPLAGYLCHACALPSLALSHIRTLPFSGPPQLHHFT